MLIEDDVLPAAAHLTGPHARSILEPVVRASGGALQSARACHVQYRPGSDVVVRFTANVSWRGAAPVRETLLAGTSVDGPPAGTVTMVADDDGRPLTVGVWRWPFDPVLTSLPDVVTPGRVDRLLRGYLVPPLGVEVVAYRPTERVVARVSDLQGRSAYVKVVDPRRTGALVERHEQLRAAGVPVAEVVAADPTRGWFAMAALHGPTLRDRLKAGHRPWPGSKAFVELVERLGAVALPGAAPVRRRIDDAFGHAAMLARVLPDQARPLRRITELLEAGDSVAVPPPRTIHGDLHEGQLVLDDAVIAGLLDIDDTGPGDPLDDLATVLAHLRFRAATSPHHDALDAYGAALRRGFERDVDPAALALRTAAVLVGLATGPFRIQQHNWRHEVRRHLRVADRLAEDAAAAIG